MKIIAMFLVVLMMTCVVSATDICAEWNSLLNALYIPVNQTGNIGNSEVKLVTLSACPIPGSLVDLQAAENDAYKNLKGKQNCSLEEFAGMVTHKWKHPTWTLRCTGDQYNEALVAIVQKDGLTNAVRVNLPQWISGLDKSIARDGYLNATGQVVIRNTIKNVTELKLYEAAA